MNSDILTLLIVLFGLCLIVAGPRGARFFFRPLVSRFKIAFTALIALLFSLLARPYITALRSHLPDLSWDAESIWLSILQPSSNQNPVRSTPPVRSPSMADRFIPLKQMDPSIFNPPALASRPDPGEPSRTFGQNACLATVYLMLERERGDSTARISESWYDANGDVFRPSYVGGDEPFSLAQALHELDAGRPVILRGAGGGYDSHFCLMVGVKHTASEIVLEALDPDVGRMVELPIRDQYPLLPRWPGHRIQIMRRVR